MRRGRGRGIQRPMVIDDLLKDLLMPGYIYLIMFRNNQLIPLDELHQVLGLDIVVEGFREPSLPGA